MFLKILRFAPSNLPKSLEQDPLDLEVRTAQLFLLVRVHAGGRCAHGGDGSAHIGNDTTHTIDIKCTDYHKTKRNNVQKWHLSEYWVKSTFCLFIRRLCNHSSVAQIHISYIQTTTVNVS